MTVQEYQPFTRDLDGVNELHISTYPAWFGRETASIPFIYKALETHDEVYFQVFVRDKAVGAGPNPNIESIRIHSFSYEFPDQEPVELLRDYDSNFWMQGNPDDNPGMTEPVPYSDHRHVRIRIDLMVNGQEYSFDERIEAAPRQTVAPLILHAL